ncbi:MerR family transcriptional regulator [Paenibacillus sp. GCM10012306]|uniref:MerR family transcriptional regulator n=1 Tax=Paenibacillus sp. GCM10012306 TaxID=3317342 RepID=UPI00361EB196
MGSFAKLTSTTVRTLHFYDQKGLLKPSGYNEQGHRTYTDDDLFRLHQILTLKYLDYSLDEIGKYLEQDSKDFKTSLERQYELLMEKQEHIQRVVASVKRVKEIVKDNDTMDPSLIMLLIHSIQHEEAQKQWFSDRVPDEVVQSVFMSESSVEERIRVEREFTLEINDLMVMYKQGLPPEHPLVQEHAFTLFMMIERMLGQELWNSETGKVLEEMDPQLFPNLEQDFKNYLIEAFGQMLIRQWGEIDRV